MTRVRGFTQDDAHHFCRPDQMPAEIDFVLDFNLHILRAFGLTSSTPTSAPVRKSMLAIPNGGSTQKALQASLERAGVPYKVDEGGGAFYRPKIDIKVHDAIGREWQLSTIQFDFNLPIASI